MLGTGAPGARTTDSACDPISPALDCAPDHGLRSCAQIGCALIDGSGDALVLDVTTAAIELEFESTERATSLALPSSDVSAAHSHPRPVRWLSAREGDHQFRGEITEEEPGSLDVPRRHRAAGPCAEVNSTRSAALADEGTR